MSEETRDGFLPLQPAELTLAREMLGLDNIGFDNMAIGKFAINNIGLHIVANGNIGIGRQSFS